MKIFRIIIPIILVAGVAWYFFGMPGLPKPKTELVVITASPPSVHAGEDFVVGWQVNNPEFTLIPHTAVHYGTASQPDISYPNFTKEFAEGNFTIPNTFIASATAPNAPGKLYFRAHAVIEDKDVWTAEKVIDIQPVTFQKYPPQEIPSVKPVAEPEPTSDPEPVPAKIVPPSVEEPTPPPQPEATLQTEPTPEPVPEPAPPPAQPSVQEINLEQSVYPGYFFPDPLIVKKDTPLRLLVTTKQREHINRISIQPWVSSSDVILPGKVTIVEFTPDLIGEFYIRNIGHGFTGTLKVVE